MELKSQMVHDCSIQDGLTDVCGGVMDSVSGLRDISWRDGRMVMDSCGFRLRRSSNAAATVESALRRLEETILDDGIFILLELPVPFEVPARARALALVCSCMSSLLLACIFIL